jgi:hypothetical protein
LVSLSPDYLLFETLCFHSLPCSFCHIPRLSDFTFRGCRYCGIFAFACLFCRLLVNVPFCCYTHLLYRKICWLLPLVPTQSLALFSLPLPRGLNDEVRPKRRLLLFRRRCLLQSF